MKSLLSDSWKEMTSGTEENILGYPPKVIFFFSISPKNLEI